MLSKRQRIKSSDFKKIYTKGRSVNKSSFLKLRYLPSEHFKAAVLVPKKVIKKRVLRNKQKRRILALLRIYQEKLSFAVVITVFKDTKDLSFVDLEKELKKIMESLA